MKKITTFPYSKCNQVSATFYPAFAFLFGLRLDLLHFQYPVGRIVDLVLTFLLPVILDTQIRWFRRMVAFVRERPVGQRIVLIVTSILPLAILLSPLDDSYFAAWAYSLYFAVTLYGIVHAPRG